MGEQPARRHRHRLAVGALEDAQRRDAADIVPDEIRTGVDRGDAGHSGRGAGVDRDDLRVRMRRAQHVQPQRAVLRLVVDELPLPGQQPLVFQTLDGLARSETQIAGKNVHSVGSSRSFRNCGQPFSGSTGGIPAAVLGGISTISACGPANLRFRRVGKGALAPCPRSLNQRDQDDGHASLCPPYALRIAPE
ncbi:hypothetical protein ABIE90_001613 [Bradyrhizobium diazoefficiens]